MDLLKFLHALPEAQQQVVTLRYIQDLSIRDVVRIINRSEGAVKQLALRGLRALRERMDDGER
ncbi:RNA polymerase sigma factor [Desulfotruncus alcoholivorax]|uniref:RNA polymerase sigma factor n=1 Tax=Desulfotruncus alcoholivorax TaxID=265477 RepID=UPI0004154761|nr:sigma factor-like helix-turn-helix DNA-binding protein [Desulfotruncus alcoholivorax]